MNDAILALNVGSSSVKLAVFDAATLEPVARGAITDLGRAAQASFESPPGVSTTTPPIASTANIQDAIRWLLDALRARYANLRLAAVGHRVVHGGTRFVAPVKVDATVLAGLDALASLAPAHQPAALAVIRSVQALFPDVPQVACFDTAFHRTQAKLSQWFALPRALGESGIVRIGFHGLSYAYIAGALPGVAGPRAHARVVAAHLGHGASVCALRDLRSVATSMGFTPLDGLMMATRCGAIDPGVLLYLLRDRGMPVDELADLLGNRSGLLGVSGISGDVRVLEASTDPRAREALDMFAARAAAAIAALLPALGGLDALVFTGGIGEHDAAMRERICRRLRWAGVAISADANAEHRRRISADSARVDVYVIPTDEERVIAAEAAALCCRSPPGQATARTRPAVEKCGPS